MTESINVMTYVQDHRHQLHLGQHVVDAPPCHSDSPRAVCVVNNSASKSKLDTAGRQLHTEIVVP